MKSFNKLVEKFSSTMDRMAGFCVIGVMILVVSNILLRKVFKQPILGTYELVGYLTALGISLALAHCAIQNGHIALDYIVNKFPKKIHTLTDFAINLVALIFWVFSAWHLGLYAQDLMTKGVVSSTAQLPVYPFVLIIGFGLLGLCLVLLKKASESFLTLITDITLIKRPYQSAQVKYVRKAVR